MGSVTSRISEVQQPYGGFLAIKQFEKIAMEDGLSLSSEENIHSSLIGLSVDYLSRFMDTGNAEEAFKISLLGANLAGMGGKAHKLLTKIKGTDDDSIVAATRLAGFDCIFRAGISAYRPIEDICPNRETIDNIRIMVNRVSNFISVYGPVIEDGFTFENAYTSTICSGDGDLLLPDFMCDLKCVKKLTSKHSLQILIYYIMGQHTGRECFKVKYIGFFNPRENIVYRYDTSLISAEVIKEVEESVIGYGSILPLNHSENNSKKISEDMDDAVYVNVKEGAAALGITQKLYKEYVKDGTIPSQKLGRKTVVLQSDIDRLKEIQDNYRRKQIKLQIVVSLIVVAVFCLFGAFLWFYLR